MQNGFEGIGALVYFALIILWLLVPVLILKYVKEMRDLAIESRLEVKELNANLKYLKRKFNESNEQQT